MKVNLGPPADDYAAFRAGFPDGILRPSGAGYGIASGSGTQKRALDLGTGTGTLARALGRARLARDRARYFRRHDRRGAADWTQQPVSTSTTWSRDRRLPVLPAGRLRPRSSAGTCWHWFDKPAAAPGRPTACWTPNGPAASSRRWSGSRDPATSSRPPVRLIHKHNPQWPDDQLGFTL